MILTGGETPQRTGTCHWTRHCRVLLAVADLNSWLQVFVCRHLVLTLGFEPLAGCWLRSGVGAGALSL